MITIGFDTSNYTTSIAYFDGINGNNCSQLLPVKAGELGLRQADAVFAHIKSLPELSGRLFSHVQADKISSIGVSTRPRAVEGSYMPCFMVGYSHAKLLADALHMEESVLLDEQAEFVLKAGEVYGSRGSEQAQRLVEEISGLYSGGELCDEDMDAMMEAIQEAYWIAKKRNRRQTSARPKPAISD